MKTSALPRARGEAPRPKASTSASGQARYRFRAPKFGSSTSTVVTLHLPRRVGTATCFTSVPSRTKRISAPWAAPANTRTRSAAHRPHMSGKLAVRRGPAKPQRASRVRAPRAESGADRGNEAADTGHVVAIRLTELSFQQALLDRCLRRKAEKIERPEDEEQHVQRAERGAEPEGEVAGVGR